MSTDDELSERAFKRMGSEMAETARLQRELEAAEAALAAQIRRGMLAREALAKEGYRDDEAEAHQLVDRMGGDLSAARETVAGLLAWAVERWRAEVQNRPLVNVSRRALDDTWRQVVRRAGGDPDALLGPRHDALVTAQFTATS